MFLIVKKKKLLLNTNLENEAMRSIQGFLRKTGQIKPNLPKSSYKKFHHSRNKIVVVLDTNRYVYSKGNMLSSYVCNTC